ncbi:hypothetical protein D908_07751 [Vibrio mimicus CAIM 602]|nr:hypothetical protein D908_07751 [Vibrio mimicus CAIM 602]
MMDFATALFSILTIHLMASISPGPDFVVVSQKTLLQAEKPEFFAGWEFVWGCYFTWVIPSRD